MLQVLSLQSSDTSTLSVLAANNIPIHTAVLGGFASVYALHSPDTAFVAVTHTGLWDSNQNPDGWHTHNVDLAFHASTGSDACIVGVTDTTAGLTIQGSTLSVNVRNSELAGPLTGGATAFTIVSDSGCTVTGLGVDLS